MAEFGDMPVEVLEKIVSHLNDGKSIQNTQLCSRKLSDIVEKIFHEYAKDVSLKTVTFEEVEKPRSWHLQKTAVCSIRTTKDGERKGRELKFKGPNQNLSRSFLSVWNTSRKLEKLTVHLSLGPIERKFFRDTVQKMETRPEVETLELFLGHTWKYTEVESQLCPEIGMLLAKLPALKALNLSWRKEPQPLSTAFVDKILEMHYLEKLTLACSNIDSEPNKFYGLTVNWKTHELSMWRSYETFVRLLHSNEYKAILQFLEKLMAKMNWVSVANFKEIDLVNQHCETYCVGPTWIDKALALFPRVMTINLTNCSPWMHRACSEAALSSDEMKPQLTERKLNSVFFDYHPNKTFLDKCRIFLLDYRRDRMRFENFTVHKAVKLGYSKTIAEGMKKLEGIFVGRRKNAILTQNVEFKDKEVLSKKGPQEEKSFACSDKTLSETVCCEVDERMDGGNIEDEQGNSALQKNIEDIGLKENGQEKSSTDRDYGKELGQIGKDDVVSGSGESGTISSQVDAVPERAQFLDGKLDRENTFLAELDREQSHATSKGVLGSKENPISVESPPKQEQENETGTGEQKTEKRSMSEKRENSETGSSSQRSTDTVILSGEESNTSDGAKDSEGKRAKEQGSNSNGKNSVVGENNNKVSNKGDDASETGGKRDGTSVLSCVGSNEGSAESSGTNTERSKDSSTGTNASDISYSEECVMAKEEDEEYSPSDSESEEDAERENDKPQRYQTRSVVKKLREKEEQHATAGNTSNGRRDSAYRPADGASAEVSNSEIERREKHLLDMKRKQVENEEMRIKRDMEEELQTLEEDELEEVEKLLKRRRKKLEIQLKETKQRNKAYLEKEEEEMNRRLGNRKEKVLVKNKIDPDDKKATLEAEQQATVEKDKSAFVRREGLSSSVHWAAEKCKVETGAIGTTPSDVKERERSSTEKYSREPKCEPESMRDEGQGPSFHGAEKGNTGDMKDTEVEQDDDCTLM